MKFTKKEYGKNTGKEKSSIIKNCSDRGWSLSVLCGDDPAKSLANEIAGGKVSIEVIKPQHQETLPEKWYDRFIGPRKVTVHGIYKVNPPYTLELLDKWLETGNWIAVAPALKSIPPVSVFEQSDGEIKNYMVENKIKIVIDSFHDDIEWAVGTFEN